MRIALISLLTSLSLIAGLIGCGDEDTSVSSAASGCAQCGADQLCVVTYGETDSTRCAPIPPVCGARPSCADQTCEAAMYEACGEDFFNIGCSASTEPVTISCNP